MQRRSFPAMGTQVELFLDAEPSAESELAFARAEQEFERLEALLSRFRPDSELSALNRSGALDAGDDLVAVTRLARRGTGADRRTLRSRPSTTPSSPRATTARSTRSRPKARPSPPRACGGEIRIDRRAESSSSPASGSTSAGSRRATRSTARARLLDRAGPCLVNAGGDLAGRGRLWPVGVETGDGSAHARPRGRRARHLGPRPPPLAARRHRGTPSDRSGHRQRPPRATCSG